MLNHGQHPLNALSLDTLSSMDAVTALTVQCFAGPSQDEKGLTIRNLGRYIGQLFKVLSLDLDYFSTAGTGCIPVQQLLICGQKAVTPACILLCSFIVKNRTRANSSAPGNSFTTSKLLKAV